MLKTLLARRYGGSVNAVCRVERRRAGYRLCRREPSRISTISCSSTIAEAVVADVTLSNPRSPAGNDYTAHPFCQLLVLVIGWAAALSAAIESCVEMRPGAPARGGQVMHRAAGQRRRSSRSTMVRLMSQPDSLMPFCTSAAHQPPGLARSITFTTSALG
jgi:hypothetical protein